MLEERGVDVDETSVKVKGKWVCLYRAVDKDGDTVDFYLSATRNTKAAKRFLGKGSQRPEGLGKAVEDQHRQGADLWSGDLGP